MLKNLLIWVVALALSAMSGTTVMGAIAKNEKPVLALSLYPTNGFAAESLAAAMAKNAVAENQGKFPDSMNEIATAYAVRAFEAEPVAPDAVAVIALAKNGQVRLDLMQNAFELSRRKQLVIGWMATESLAQNDVSGILKYYDTALRTNAAADVIIPVMANALANDNFIKPLKATLARNPAWAGLFWREVVYTPQAIGNAADLRQMLYRRTEPDGIYQDAALIDSLVKDGQFKKAEQLYATLSESGKDRSIAGNLDFRSASRYPPMDWQLFSAGDYGAFVSQDSLNLSAVSNSGGLFARKLVKLPKSRLTLEVAFGETIPQTANLNLGLICAENIDDKPAAIRIRMTGKSIRKKISSEATPCRYYWLEITGRSVDTRDGFDVNVVSISLMSG